MAFIDQAPYQHVRRYLERKWSIKRLLLDLCCLFLLLWRWISSPQGFDFYQSFSSLPRGRKAIIRRHTSVWGSVWCYLAICSR